MSRLRLPSAVRNALARHLARADALSGQAGRRRACLFKVDRLGDFVLALGAIRTLVRHYGASQCRLVISDVVAPLAALEFPDVARWVAPAAASAVLQEVRPLRRTLAPTWATEQFDDLVCLRHAPSTYRDVALHWLHARRWIGLGARPAAGRLPAANRPGPPVAYPTSDDAPWCRELLAHRAVVAAATGGEPDWETLRPRFSSITPRRGDALVLCPFGNEAIRDYPEDSWIAAWRGAALPAGPVRLIGPSARLADLSRLADRLRREANRPDIEVEADLPLPAFLDRLAAARMILTVESFAAHVAAALDKPAVVITGGGHFGWFAPWGEATRQRWLHLPLPCFGCRWDCVFPTVRCLVELPPDAVAQALQEVMVHV